MRLSLKRDQLSPEAEARRGALKEAQRRLKEAEKAHEQRVKTAKKAYAAAQKSQASGLKDVESRLADARKDRKLGSLAGVTLYEDRIETPDGVAELSDEVRADVDTAGNLAMSSRVTATRLVTLGVFAFAFKKKKKHDTRELYLVVETPEFMTVRQIDPNLGPRARSFVAQITTATRQAETSAEAKRQAVGAATEERKRVHQDTAAIDSAWRELEDAEADTQEVERLRAEVERLSRAEVSPSVR